MIRPWLGQNKPPLGVLPIPGHPLRPAYANLFREGGGPVVHDDIAGIAGTLTNGPIWTPNSVVFDGADDYLIASQQPPFLMTGWSVAWRANLGAHGVGDVSARICDWYPAPSVYRDSFNKLGWYGNIGGVSRDWPISTGTITGSTMTVVVSFDGTTTRVWINGVLDNALTTYTGVLTAPSNTFCIAGRSTGTDRCMAGTFEWFQMWTAGLTHDAAVAITAQPFSWLGVPDLAAMWAAQAAPAVGAPGYYYRYQTRLWGEA